MIIEIIAESQEIEESDNLTFIKAMNLGLHDILLNNLSFFGSKELNTFSRTCQYFRTLFFLELSDRLFKHIASATMKDCIAMGYILQNNYSLLFEPREVEESANNVIKQITPYEFALNLGYEPVVRLLNQSFVRIGQKAVVMAKNSEQFDVLRAIKLLASQLSTEKLRIDVQKKILFEILFNIKEEVVESNIIDFLINRFDYINSLKQSYISETLVEKALKGNHFSILQKIIDKCPSWKEEQGFLHASIINFFIKENLASRKTIDLAMVWIKEELPNQEGFNESLLWFLFKNIMVVCAPDQYLEFLDSFLEILEKKCPADILKELPNHKRLLLLSKIPTLLNKKMFLELCTGLNNKDEVSLFLQENKSIWIDYIHDLNFLCPLLKKIRHEEFREIILNEKPDFWENLTANNLLQMVTNKPGWFDRCIHNIFNMKEGSIFIKDKAIYETLYSSNLLVKTIPPKELANFINQIPENTKELVLKLYFSSLLNNLENANHFLQEESLSILLLNLQSQMDNFFSLKVKDSKSYLAFKERCIRLIQDKHCELFRSFEINWLDAIVFSIQYISTLVSEDAKVNYQQNQKASFFKAVELNKFDGKLEELKISFEEIPDIVQQKSSCNIL